MNKKMVLIAFLALAFCLFIFPKNSGSNNVSDWEKCRCLGYASSAEYENDTDYLLNYYCYGLPYSCKTTRGFLFEASQNPQLCDDEFYIPSDFCYEILAVETGNFSLCQNAGSIDCYEQAAFYSKDPSFCEMIKAIVNPASMELMDRCYEKLAQKADYLHYGICDNILTNNEDSRLNDKCNIQFALKMKNVTFCDKVESDDYRNYCMAGVKGDSSFCPEISDSILKAECPPVTMHTPEYYKNLSVSFCESWGNDKCFEELAIKTGNETACVYMKKEHGRKSCLAKLEKNISICDEIPDFYLRIYDCKASILYGTERTFSFFV